jgi:hypothetical protein
MNIFEEIEKETQGYSLGQIIEEKVSRLYTHQRTYQSGFTKWIAYDDEIWPDGPRGFGRSEQEAIEDLAEQLRGKDAYT